jgi:uncharacterized protein (DUF3084 family)
MAWEDIDKARTELASKKEAKETKKAEREKKKAEKEAQKAEQEAQKAGKSTRGRKRKACPVATDVPEPSPKSPRISEMLAPMVPQMDWLSDEQRIAPVARMI